MKVSTFQDSISFDKPSFDSLEREKVPAELKKLEEVGTILLRETGNKMIVISSESNLYRILYRFTRDFDIELV